MTTFTEADVTTIIADPSKMIVSDINWRRTQTYAPASWFLVDVASEGDYPLSIKGWYNPASGKLSFSLLVHGEGRVYGLDLGAEHRNPDGQLIGETHKNRWKDGQRDKHAYAPPDITATWSEPESVWEQFCREINLRHDGTMYPPVAQGEFWL